MNYFNPPSVYLIVLLIAVGPLIGFLPTIVGRNKKNCRAILALNVFGGWTGIGWIVAMVWACMVDSPEDERHTRPLAIGRVLIIVYLLNVVVLVVLLKLNDSQQRDDARARELTIAAEDANARYRMGLPPSGRQKPSPEDPKQIAPRNPTSASGTQTSFPSSPEQSSASLPPPPVARLRELVVIRGTVAASRDGILIVNCQKDPVKPGFVWNLDTSGMGAGGIAQLAKLATDTKIDPEKEFGPLQMLSTGSLRGVRPNMVPAERPLGRFAISGYPGKADHVHVVAAPTGFEYEGVPLYAVDFKLQTVVPATTSNPFPPGVDTPEQRRAYLEALHASRNSAR